jgi:hypothetical protein
MTGDRTISGTVGNVRTTGGTNGLVVRYRGVNLGWFPRNTGRAFGNARD